MTPLTTAEFTRALADLDRSALAAFVADLYRERGYAVSVDGDRLRVERDGEVRRYGVLVGRGPGRWPTGGVARAWPTRRATATRLGDCDVVVSADPSAAPTVDSGQRLVTPADLRDHLLYGIGRPSAERLCADHLGRALATNGVDTAPRDRDRRLASLLLVACVVVVGAFGGGAALDTAGGVGTNAGDGVLGVLGVPDGERQDGTAPSGEPTATGETGDAVEDGEADTSTPDESVGALGASDSASVGPEPAFAALFAGGVETPTPGASPLPPGVSEDGSIDADRLAAAHGEIARNTSYTLELQHREFIVGSEIASQRELVRVESDGVYETTVETHGDPDESLVVDRRAAYANGSARVERTDDGIRVRPLGPWTDGDRYADRVADYLGWYLSVNESELVASHRVEGRTFYRIRFGSDPWPGTVGESGVAVVDDRGFVYYLTRESEDPDQPGITDVITIRYSLVGETTVTPPRWRTGNETARRTVPTVTPPR